MRAAYLYLNCVLYLIFALWCTLLPTRTATALGYTALSRGGASEYLVIYGGLQLGLACLFGLLAYDATRHEFGILVAVALYTFIVIYRIVTVMQHWPVASLTLATAALEVALLIMGALLLMKTS